MVCTHSNLPGVECFAAIISYYFTWYFDMVQIVHNFVNKNNSNHYNICASKYIVHMYIINLASKSQNSLSVYSAWSLLDAFTYRIEGLTEHFAVARETIQPIWKTFWSEDLISVQYTKNSTWGISLYTVLLVASTSFSSTTIQS